MNRAVILPSIEATQEVKVQANTYTRDGAHGGGFQYDAESGTMNCTVRLWAIRGRPIGLAKWVLPERQSKLGPKIPFTTTVDRLRAGNPSKTLQRAE